MYIAEHCFKVKDGRRSYAKCEEELSMFCKSHLGGQQHFNFQNVLFVPGLSSNSNMLSVGRMELSFASFLKMSEWFYLILNGLIGESPIAKSQ